jgi:hypothetical protein
VSQVGSQMTGRLSTRCRTESPIGRTASFSNGTSTPSSKPHELSSERYFDVLRGRSVTAEGLRLGRDVDETGWRQRCRVQVQGADHR